MTSFAVVKIFLLRWNDEQHGVIRNSLEAPMKPTRPHLSHCTLPPGTSVV